MLYDEYQAQATQDPQDPPCMTNRHVPDAYPQRQPLSARGQAPLALGIETFAARTRMLIRTMAILAFVETGLR